ncbi:MAG: hypothetical protein LBK60_01435 [Verrucomicrobiales bacterium]|jgi:hypothetical protein|nr:hypothetical protein [Verrucomicrobiales bacterium]
MDPVLARRLENDEGFRKKIRDLADNYIKLGKTATEAHFYEFDEALDLYNCLASLSRNDMERLDKGSPRRYILPMSATQAATAVAFLAGVLFGENKPHKVEARNPGDTQQSDMMNMLLRWNAEQQPFYLLGHAWCLDAWLHNRGILYENWQRIYDVTIEPVEMEDPEETETVQVPMINGLKPDGVLNAMLPTRSVTRPKRYQRFKKQRTVSGGYTRMTNVAPYDFIADPTLPLYRMNEGRFAGHRMEVPWLELERRSKLAPTDSEYVSPRAVEELKKGKGARDGIGGVPIPTTISPPAERRAEADGMVTATAFARERRVTLGGAAVNAADKHDGGPVELWVLRVRIAPADYDLYEGDTDKNVWEILLAGSEVLSVNEDTYLHDEFPYMVGEARPNLHTQFSPSWQMIIKPLQDHVDYLKTRHEDALSRSVGNVFIGDPTLVDFDDFFNPETEGQVLALKKPLEPGQRLGDVISQIPVSDLTGDFWRDLNMVQNVAENTTAANNVIQGELTKNTTATANAAAQKFGTGRLMSVARVLEVQGPFRQTRRLMMNFQEFAPDEMILRLDSDNMEFRDQFQGQSGALTITRSAIQGQFDVVPLDLTLPGSDMLAVDALTKLMEASQWLPQLFDDTVPGNLNLKSIAKFTAKKAGAPVDNFIVTEEQAQKNVLARMRSAMAQLPPVAAGGGMPLPAEPPPPAPDPTQPVGPGAARVG